MKARYLGFRWEDGSVTLLWKWEGKLTSEHYSSGTWADAEPSITWVELADIAEMEKL